MRSEKVEKVKNDLPDGLSKDEMIEKITEALQASDYSTVYLTFVFLDCSEKVEKVKNDLPDGLSKDEMIEKITEALQASEYSTVYLTFVFLDCTETK